MGHRPPILERLADAPFALAEGETDVRGMTVFSSTGEELGRIGALFVDAGQRKVRLVELASGGVLGVGEDRTLVPVEAIRSIDRAGIHLAHEGERVVGAPRYDPELVDSEPRFEDLYAWYGYHPYWGPIHPAGGG